MNQDDVEDGVGGAMVRRTKTEKAEKGGERSRGSIAKANRARNNREHRSGSDREEEVARQVRQFYEMSYISVTEEQHIEETLAEFDAWGFDAMVVSEMIGKIATTIVFCRITALYDFVHSLSLDA